MKTFLDEAGLSQFFSGLKRKFLVDNFTFTQQGASSTWVILHSLRKKPSVTVIDDTGAVVLCDIEYTDENTVILRFSEPTAGVVYLN